MSITQRKPWAGRKAPKKPRQNRAYRRIELRPYWLWRDGWTHTPADLAPLQILVVRLDKCVLQPREPLHIEVHADEGLLVARTSWGVYSVGLNREELLTAVEWDIRFLWREYAKAPDSALTADAIQLAERIRSVFEEYRVFP